MDCRDNDSKEFLEKGIENFMQHIDDPINIKTTWWIMYIELFHHPIAQDIYRNEIMRRTVDCLGLFLRS
ncbi:hypothetical protein [Paenisporosarcina sp. TG20]|uniref:hypothetical protein n=1 Tax=Paenisporosarcina sp. TG20 TaxID=1211706 RepID=UPI0002DD698E|nr:hypothetical protein [Paenisporosarcina sp. TG20]